jgi:hypothetical protein
MLQKRRAFLLPTAVVAYVALAAFPLSSGRFAFALLLLPVAVAFTLARLERVHRAGMAKGSEGAPRAVTVAVGLYLASAFGPSGNLGLDAAGCAALLLATSGALLAVARVPSPGGLLVGHRAAESRDAFFVAIVSWALLTGAALLGALFPQYIDLDPSAFDTAMLFGVLGSLALLSTAELRVLLLRGIELGVHDRSRASLSLCLAGTLVAVGAAWVDVAPADRVAGVALLVVAVGVTASKMVADAAKVTRAIRGLLGLCLLGVPLALFGARAALGSNLHPATLAMAVTVGGIIVGLVAQRLARPLGPAGSRWLMASEAAMDAALQPEPDVALRETLRALRRAEPTSEARPEIFRLEPKALLSVDVAGYLSTAEVEFPTGVLELALAEPELTLRYETVKKAEVREPRVRPIVAWFESWGAKTATALLEDEGSVGLLVLPTGKRRSYLSLEEAQALGRLGRRITGLLSVNSALARSRKRELEEREAAEAARQDAERLRHQLSALGRVETDDARVFTEVLRAAGHGAASRTALLELEAAAGELALTLSTPTGVDARPWAAHLHLTACAADGVDGPFIVVDGTTQQARDRRHWLADAGASPLERANGGTLLVLSAAALPADTQREIAEAKGAALARVLLSHDPATSLDPSLTRLARGRSVILPGLEERADDLHALIVFEVSRLGLAHRGKPLGMGRAALSRLLEVQWLGNDEQLHGLLSAAVARSTGDVLEVRDLWVDDEEAAPLVELGDTATTRSRSRPAPRSRRP